jgi:outer membrane immunogenic protein
MKHTFISASIIAMLATGAIAGNIDLATADPVIAITPTTTVTDWSGAYVGLSYGLATGDLDTTVVSFIERYDFEDGSAVGGFAGYNWQSGAMVYGAELAYHSIDEMFVLIAGGDDTINATIDLRGRIGYAVGSALIYGAAGYSSIDQTVNATDENTLTGYNFGVGVEYQIRDNIVVGLDYTTRVVEGENNSTTNVFDIESTVNTLSLRVAYHF